MHIRMTTVLMLATALLTACANPSASQAPGRSTSPPCSPNRPMIALSKGEPVALALRAFQTVGGGSYPHLVLNANLDDQGQDGKPFPELAEELPQLNTATWRVLPDGTMDTIYHLKPGLVWHDGTALDAADFVFAWKVYANPLSGSATVAPVGEMQEVS